MATQDLTRPVFLPVIIGTARQGRLTEPAANFVFGEVSKRGDIQTELIDIRKIPLAVDDAGEALKDSQFSAMVSRADALILVVPEYNHSFPGLLKHVLDTNLKEYIHKAVGILRRVRRSIRRRAHDPEFGAGAAGAGTGHDFLGRLFRYRGEAFRFRFWQNYRSGLRRTRGQISERTCLDVASASARARESSDCLVASLCVLAHPRDRPTGLCCSARARRRVFGNADHSEADRTSDRAGAAQE